MEKHKVLVAVVVGLTVTLLFGWLTLMATAPNPPKLPTALKPAEVPTASKPPELPIVALYEFKEVKSMLALYSGSVYNCTLTDAEPNVIIKIPESEEYFNEEQAVAVSLLKEIGMLSEEKLKDSEEVKTGAMKLFKDGIVIPYGVVELEKLKDNNLWKDFLKEKKQKRALVMPCVQNSQTFRKFRRSSKFSTDVFVKVMKVVNLLHQESSTVGFLHGYNILVETGQETKIYLPVFEYLKNNRKSDVIRFGLMMRPIFKDKDQTSVVESDLDWWLQKIYKLALIDDSTFRPEIAELLHLLPNVLTNEEERVEKKTELKKMVKNNLFPWLQDWKGQLIARRMKLNFFFRGNEEMDKKKYIYGLLNMHLFREEFEGFVEVPECKKSIKIRPNTEEDKSEWKLFEHSESFEYLNKFVNFDVGCLTEKCCSTDRETGQYELNDFP